MLLCNSFLKSHSLTLLLTREILINSFNEADRIYVEITGSDTTGDGTKGNPYQSFDHVRSILSSSSPKAIIFGEGEFPLTTIQVHSSHETFIDERFAGSVLIGSFGNKTKLYNTNDLGLNGMHVTRIDDAAAIFKAFGIHFERNNGNRQTGTWRVSLFNGGAEQSFYNCVFSEASGGQASLFYGSGTFNWYNCSSDITNWTSSYSNGSGSEIRDCAFTSTPVLASATVSNNLNNIELDVDCRIVNYPLDGQEKVPTGTGTTLSYRSMTYGGIAATDDGITSQANTASAANYYDSASLPLEVGMDWGSGNDRTISGAVIWPSNNIGWKHSAGQTVNITLYGSHDNSSFVALGSVSQPESNSTSPENLFSGVDTSTAYRYHKIHVQTDPVYGDNRKYIAEIEYYEAAEEGEATFANDVVGVYSGFYGWGGFTGNSTKYRYFQVYVTDEVGSLGLMLSDIVWYQGVETFPKVAMTSNNAPSPLATSSSSVQSATYEPWKAYNGSTGQTNSWQSDIDAVTQGDPEWITLDVGSSNKFIPTKVKITPFINGNGHEPKDFEIRASVDGINFDTLAIFSNISDWSAGFREFELI